MIHLFLLPQLVGADFIEGFMRNEATSTNKSGTARGHCTRD